MALTRGIIPLVRAIGYGEINPSSEGFPWVSEENKLSSILERNVKRTRFVSIKISSREEVFDALKMFFNIDGNAAKQTGDAT